MTALANSIALAYQTSLFATLETTPGTLQFPAASNTDLVVPAGFPDLNQNPAFVNSDEVIYSRDILAMFQNVTPAGTFTIPMYLRPSGTLGSIPQGANLFTSLFGKQTINASTSVVYSQQVSKPSLSLWYLRGNTVFNAAGAVIDAMKMGFTTKGGALCTFSGQFLQLGYAGTAQLTAAAAAAATSITVDDGSKFTVGSVIYDSSFNAGVGDHATNGYTVTAVAGNTLTISPGIVGTGGWASGDTIQGYLPAGNAIGSPLAFRQSLFTVESAQHNLKGLDFSYADSVKILDDEITSSGYPQAYIPSQRTINGTLHSYLRRNDIDFITEGMSMNKGSLSIQVGSTAGSTVTLSMPKCVFEVPQLKNNAPAVEFDMKYTAISNSGNGEDSMTMTFA
jgi:hypothetical protein